jgi:hypothetical protein
MGMQTDVLASAVRTDDGVLNDQAGDAIVRARVKAIRIVPTSSTAGIVVFKDGGSSGATRLTVNVFAGTTGADYMLLPGEGLLFTYGIYVDVTTIASVMVFYA